ncbi:MAG: hypothetical protein ACI97A_004431 [Planctomycetota bacterium]|jgi:hypothetical protein
MTFDNEQVLADCMVRVLEEVSMIFGDKVENDDISFDADAGPFVLVKMGFSGCKFGEIEFLASESLGSEIAAGALGCEPDSAEAADFSKDSLCEFANVTLGQILIETQGEKAVFDLSTPELCPATVDDWSRLLAEEGTVIVDADDSLMFANFRVLGPLQGSGSHR